jgi:hypothetical protein
MGVLDKFFQYWYQFIPNHLPSIADKKTTLLAMVSLLTIPIDNLPNIIKMNLPMIYNMILTLVIACEQQRARTEEVKKQYNDIMTSEGIGSSAFRDCVSLSSIELPSSLDCIGGHAFDGCTNLTAVTAYGYWYSSYSRPSSINYCIDLYGKSSSYIADVLTDRYVSNNLYRW